MPRPKTISDEDILSAALEVLAREGPGFTLTHLADQVALSRATVIQRFGDRDAILRRMARHEVELTKTWLDGLPIDRDQNGLWPLLSHLVESMGTGEGFSVRVAFAALEARDVELQVMAGERYRLVQNAIAARLPETEWRLELAEHLHAVIAGATMQWVATDGSVPLFDYVLARLRWCIASSPNALDDISAY